MNQQDRFCPSCADKLVVRKAHGAERPVCDSCGRVIFYDPKLAAATVVESGGRVLFVRRLTQPGYGLWSLPGGYVDRGEVVEEAAAREVREETGLHVEIAGLVGLFSESGHPVVVAAYHCRSMQGDASPGPEVSQLGYFAPDSLPPLAFGRDREILRAWWRLVRDGDPPV